MKTKLLFSAVFLLLFLENVGAQEYHPLLNNSSWVINDWVSCCRPPEIKTIEQATDSIIDDHTYKSFIDPFPCFGGNGEPIEVICLREDVDAQKVYKRVDGADVLLYDFSMENGDTVSQYGYTFVATVDEVAVNNGFRKRISLQSIEDYNGIHFSLIWIEGVGTNAHPLYPDSNMYSVLSSGGGYKIFTKCSFQNNNYIYGNSDYCSSLLSTTTQTLTNTEIVFSPNPFSTELGIESESFLQNASFKLYNLQGQLLREANNLNGQKLIIARENLSTGSYLLQLFEEDKLIKVGKVLVD